MTYDEMTDEQKKEFSLAMYYNLSVIKRMIGSDKKGGGLSEFSRKVIEFHVEQALQETPAMRNYFEI